MGEPRKRADGQLFMQMESEWCWAACIQMVLSNQGLDVRNQCELAGSAFGLSGCCAHPSDPSCDRFVFVSQLTVELGRNALVARPIDSPVSFETLLAEVQANRVVILGLSFTLFGEEDAAGHAVVVSGWDRSEQGTFLIVYDPARGVVSDWYEDLLTAYGRGIWFFTWIGIQKG